MLCLAQDETAVYTDKGTGIVFNTWSPGDVTLGMALPANSLTTDATEFIGMLVSPSPSPTILYQTGGSSAVVLTRLD